MTINDLVVTKRVIPSYDVRKYIKDIGHKFSCRDAVLLIEYSTISLKEREIIFNYILKIAKNDRELEEYVTDYLNCTRKSMSDFVLNDGSYIYKLKYYYYRGESEEFYFTDYKSAIDFCNLHISKNKCGLHMYKTNPLNEDESEFHICIDKNGLIYYIDDYYFDPNDEKYKWAMNTPFIPHPFRQGDHVIFPYIDDDPYHGVVTWPNEKEYETDYKSYDYIDGVISLGKHATDHDFGHYRVKYIEYDKEKDS